jgi:hypothetical protein
MCIVGVNSSLDSALLLRPSLTGRRASRSHHRHSHVGFDSEATPDLTLDSSVVVGGGGEEKKVGRLLERHGEAAGGTTEGEAMTTRHMLMKGEVENGI